jgi:hypothetical protein
MNKVEPVFPGHLMRHSFQFSLLFFKYFKLIPFIYFIPASSICENYKLQLCVFLMSKTALLGLEPA